ncbi:hypothetical protein [Coleofasciculus sp. FACHB-542]|uniref:hypothetical protein n=1 Tax=Coleofasciculus sp. FACHB-542 TaxID=2692787 RepID=UPI001689EFC8|nr:hypothetical protein [Coleofasciculus sp. FACHB-542]MBD2086082.1 hypothetical protein [Coleofasciculus sp. FACHB-542]
MSSIKRQVAIALSGYGGCDRAVDVVKVIALSPSASNFCSLAIGNRSYTDETRLRGLNKIY